MHWYIDVLKKYICFDGRAGRREYWMFFLWNFIVATVLGFILSALGVPALANIYTLAVFLPYLSVSVRRLHDIGKGGLWVLINLVPLIGQIWFIILMAKRGDVGCNRFGQDPCDYPEMIHE